VKKLFANIKAFSLKRIEVNFPLPDNKFGRWLKKDGHLTPKYFRDSYAELKKVTWPSRKETWRLFLAIVVFSVVLAALIAVVDFGFEKLIERVI